MEQIRSVIFGVQRIETNSPTLNNRNVSFMAGNELRPDGQHFAPTLNPFLRIAPMPLGGESNVRQGLCII